MSTSAHVNDGSRGANPLVRFRVRPFTLARVAAISARSTAAERRSVDHSEIERRAFLVGLREIETCGACCAGLACPKHGPEAASELPPADAAPELAALAERCAPPAPPAPAIDGSPEYVETVRAYFEAYKGARGVTPVFRSREGAAVKRMIAAIGVDKSKEAIRGAYSDPFWKPKATILTIASDPSRHLGRKTGSTVQSRGDGSPVFPKAREVHG